LLEHKTSPANNSGPTTTWNGTGGNGVTKQVDPVDQHTQEWGGVPTPDVKLHTNSKAHFMAALKLARMEQELGLISADQEMNRFAELEEQTHESLQTQIQTLARVKTAGLNKLAQTRTAHRVPSALGRLTAAPHGFERIASGEETKQSTQLTDEQFDSALFSR
jgi:hypothetical protein